jgi:transcriptional regulator with XRE-family HTH domain
MRGTPTTTVAVNGYAGREIRNNHGLDAGEVAAKMGISRVYLYKIELGHSLRVSPRVFKAWMDALGVTDRRVLLANPQPAGAGNGSGDGAA